MDLCTAKLILFKFFDLEIEIVEREGYLFEITYVDKETKTVLFQTEPIFSTKIEACKCLRKLFCDLISWSKNKPIEGRSFIKDLAKTSYKLLNEIALKEEHVRTIFIELSEQKSNIKTSDLQKTLEYA